MAFTHHFWHQDPEYRQMALITLDQQCNSMTWSGADFFATPRSRIGHSRIMKRCCIIQASNVLNYLEAYQSTGLATYREVVEGTMHYVTRFLSDHTRGGFYASQDADVRRGDGSGADVLGDEFFALNESQRLVIGIPTVDRDDIDRLEWHDGQSVSSGLQALGNEPVREFALTTLRRLYNERYQPGRGLAHFLRDGHARNSGCWPTRSFLRTP